MMSREGYDGMAQRLYRRAQEYHGPDKETAMIVGEGVEILSRILLDIREVVVYHLDEAPSKPAEDMPPIIKAVSTARDKLNAAKVIAVDWDEPLARLLDYEVIELGVTMMSGTNTCLKVAAADARLLTILDRYTDWHETTGQRQVKGLIAGARDVLDMGLKDHKGGE